MNPSLSSGPSSTPPKIAIIGGGPGGLTLARILHVHGIPCTVFERDEHALARPQGGSLDIHPDSGQFAIQLCGLEQEFAAVARPEDQGNRLFDRDGNLRFEEENAERKNRPEVDRSALRAILLAALPADTVHWGTRVSAVRSHPSGGYEVVCNSEGPAVFDLVVGADGAFSQVRPLLSPAKAAYSGITFMDMSIDDVDARYPEIANLVGRGKMMVPDGERALMAQRNADGHVRVYAMLALPPDWAVVHGVDRNLPADLRAFVAAQYAGWSSSLRAIVEAVSDRIVPWPIYELPVGHRWANRPGVTLLGDAAHLMSPFGGNGVNFAMLDAAMLAQALLGSERGDGTGWAAAVAEYEAEMCARVVSAAESAARAVRKVVSPEGPSHADRHMETTYGSHASARENEDAIDRKRPVMKT